jgi:hypothetical protein
LVSSLRLRRSRATARGLTNSRLEIFQKQGSESAIGGDVQAGESDAANADRASRRRNVDKGMQIEAITAIGSEQTLRSHVARRQRIP